jgi:hypothetical protein
MLLSTQLFLNAAYFVMAFGIVERGFSSRYLMTFTVRLWLDLNTGLSSLLFLYPEKAPAIIIIRNAR